MSEPAPGPTAFDVRPSSTQLTRTVPFRGFLRGNNRELTLDFGTDTHPFLDLFAMFESVRLDSLSFQVVVSQGSSHCVEWSISDDASTSIRDAFYYGICPGSDQCMTINTVELPRDHQFGKEVKATVLGNNPPVIRLAASGGADNDTNLLARVLGHGTFTLSGHGVLDAIVLR